MKSNIKFDFNFIWCKDLHKAIACWDITSECSISYFSTQVFELIPTCLDAIADFNIQ